MAESIRSGPEKKDEESIQVANHAEAVRNGISLQEWLDQVKAEGRADTLPQVAGKKKKTEFAEAVSEQALAAAFGEYKGVRDPTGFESGIKAYAHARSRGVESRVALLRATQEVGDADVQKFRQILPGVETRLQTIGVPASDIGLPIESPAAEVAAIAQESNPVGGRMTEEELLKGLEGLNEPEPAAKVKTEHRQSGSTSEKKHERAEDVPEGWDEKLGRERGGLVRYLVSADGKMRVARPLRPGDEERLAHTLEQVESTAIDRVRPAETKKLKHEMSVDDDGRENTPMDHIDVIDRRRKISAESKKKKSEKKGTRKEKKTVAGPDDTEAARSSGPSERLSLPSATVEDLTKAFGSPQQVGRMPFWPLGDEAVIFDKLHSADEAPRTYRVGDGGVHRFPLGWHRYDAEKKTFTRITNDQLDELRAGLRRNLVDVWGEDPKMARDEPEKAPEVKETRVKPSREHTPEDRIETKREGISRPSRDPSGVINGFSYWKERRHGSVLIEDTKDENVLYRVQRDGLHWVRGGPEDGRGLNQKGLFWDGSKFDVVTRGQWRELVREREEEKTEESTALATEPATDTAERRAERESARSPADRIVPSLSSRADTPTLVPRTPIEKPPDPETALRSRLEQVGKVMQRFPLDLAAAIAEPKIGASLDDTTITTEKEQIGTALNRLASTDKDAFERAQRAITSLSTFQRNEYKRIENEIDGMARYEKISHTAFADMLHEPELSARVEMMKNEVRSSLGLFGSIWNRMTFGLYTLVKARRIARAAQPLGTRMQKAEEEFGRRRGLLRTILGLS